MRLIDQRELERYRKCVAGKYYFVRFGDDLMATKSIVVCDVCGKQKGETNHWWIVAVYTREPHLRVLPSKVPSVGAEEKDCCGQECVAKAVQQWMAGIDK